MTDTQQDWEKDFFEQFNKWQKGQYGACMCLGNCQKCGYHICHGCACWIAEFIKDLLKQRDESLVVELENKIKKINKYKLKHGLEGSFNQAIDQAIALVREREE